MSVFEGNELKRLLPQFNQLTTRCSFMGTDSENGKITVPFDESLLSKHILFLGGIGTGKTNSIFQIVAQLQKSLAPEDVMLIFDTKGDFYDTFYKKGDIVISNDEKATGAQGVDYWNIFEEIGLDISVEEAANEISRTLFFEKIQRSTQPFFPNAARDLFVGLLLHFFREDNNQTKNNEYFRSFLDSVSTDEVKEILQKHDDLKAMTSYIKDPKSPQTLGVFSELQQLIRDIFISNFRRNGSLSMRKSIRNKGGKTIFIEYDLGSGEILTPIYRLLLDMAIKEALSRKKSEGNVWFIIDEFRLIPNLQHIDNGINFGRSLGAKFIIGVQNVEQIFHAYGESMARSMLSGFNTIVAFRVNDITTRQYIQERFGRNRKQEAYSSVIASRGVIEQVREANVVEDWDISNLTLGEAIIGLPEDQPFLFQFDKFEL